MTLQSIIDHFDLLMDTPESVPKLRQFILQLAVQGKLTEQDPDDEPAEELLKRIKAEKQRLYEAGAIRRPKNLSLPPKDNTPFSLPQSWSWVRVGQVGEIQTGATPSTKREEFYGDEYPFIKPSDITSSQVDYTGAGLSKAGIENGRRIKSGSVLMVSIGGSIGKVGRVTRECSCNQQINVIYPYPPLLSCFVEYAMRSAYFQDAVSSKAGTTTMPIINQTKWLNLPLPLPPLEEQQRIVATVDRLMDACDTLEVQQEAAAQVRVRATASATQALQTADTPAAVRTAWHRLHDHFDVFTTTPDDVDALRQTILQLAVQGKLTAQDPDDEPADELLERIKAEKQRLYEAGEIRKPKEGSIIEGGSVPFNLPSGWHWARLTDCVLRTVDCLHKTAPFEEEVTGYYCVDTTCMNESEIEFKSLRPVSKITYEEWTRRMVPKAGDILFSREGSIGLTAVVPDGVNLCLGQRMMIFRLSNDFQSGYFHKVLMSPVIVNQWRPSITGTAATRINISRIRQFLLPVAPPEEQQRIVATVDQMMDICDRLEAQLSQQQELGVGLLEAVLHGAVQGEGQPVAAEAVTVG